MRICIVGKYPPIQGGVSTRTYLAAHALAAQGNEVHVVTNAIEVQLPFRMYMRPEDWARCEAQYDNGAVLVHWTEPPDRSQSYIPMASPYVSKLAGVAAAVHLEHPFDVVYSHYLEPYGVAACLAAQITGIPHVARMAGSDAGRLWYHPQLRMLYDHVLRSAELVIAAGEVAERAVGHGVEPERVVHGGQFTLPEELFRPEGPRLDLAALRAQLEAAPEMRDAIWGNFEGQSPYFGIYGKLGESKGSFALLAAMQRLKAAGLEIGLVALAHGPARVENEFRTHARKLGLADHVLQIPFLPHWRVPEFLRSCVAVCCLEQEFPIGFHNPIIALEALLCGSCLVASTEVIRKLPQHSRLPHGYSCVAVEDVNDIEHLSGRLAAIVRDPGRASAVGARGCRFARELQSEIEFPHTLERILKAAAARQGLRLSRRGLTQPAGSSPPRDRFALTRLAEAALTTKRNRSGRAKPSTHEIDLAHATRVLADLKQTVSLGHKDLETLIAGVDIERRIAVAENEPADAGAKSDALFRLRLRSWAMGEDDLRDLVPRRDPRLRLLKFDFDVRQFAAVKSATDLPSLAPGPSYVIAFVRGSASGRGSLMIDPMTAQILQVCDGTRTCLQIATELSDGRHGSTEDNLTWIEHIFVQGLISLEDEWHSSGNSPRDKVFRR